MRINPKPEVQHDCNSGWTVLWFDRPVGGGGLQQFSHTLGFGRTNWVLALRMANELSYLQGYRVRVGKRDVRS